MFCHFRGITILGTVCMYRLGAVESSSAIQSALINMYVHGLDYTTIMENIIWLQIMWVLADTGIYQSIFTLHYRQDNYLLSVKRLPKQMKLPHLPTILTKYHKFVHCSTIMKDSLSMLHNSWLGELYPFYQCSCMYQSIIYSLQLQLQLARTIQKHSYCSLHSVISIGKCPIDPVNCCYGNRCGWWIVRVWPLSTSNPQ